MTKRREWLGVQLQYVNPCLWRSGVRQRFNTLLSMCGRIAAKQKLSMVAASWKEYTDTGSIMGNAVTAGRAGESELHVTEEHLQAE